jgi:hypothetical protein
MSALQPTLPKTDAEDRDSILQSILAAERPPWAGCIVPVVVTPAMARAWLTRNTHNRKPLTRWIARLKDIIRRGDWRLSPAMIAFDWIGVLLDGQNRLYAIIEADQPCVCLVGYGFDPACFSVLDSGAKRTFANVLTIEHEENYVTQAAAYAKLWKYLYSSADMTGGGAVPTSQQLLQLRAEHPAMPRSVKIALPGWPLASTGLLAFCHYVFSRKDTAIADVFMESLISGVMLAERSPVKRLRARMEDNRAAKAKLLERELLALIFKAWNYTRDGRTDIPFIRWSEGAGEPFPQVK